MDHRQMLFGFLRIAPKRERAMLVAHLVQVTISAPAVSADDRPRRYAILDECGERVGIAAGDNGSACLRDNAEAKAPSINKFCDWNSAFMSGFPFGATIFGVLARPDFNRADNRCLVMDASSFASRFRRQRSIRPFPTGCGEPMVSRPGLIIPARSL